MNKLLLIGNPNTGKTTLFNTLTNSYEKASNWHGVTVDVRSKKYKFKNQEINVCDLPGVYSLEGYSKEEKIATDFLNKNNTDLVINICDENNLERNLILTMQLIEAGFNVVIAVNMINKKELYDYNKLEQILHVKIIKIDARKKSGVSEIKQFVFDYYNKEKTQNKSKILKISYQNNQIIKIIAKNKNDAYRLSDKIDKFILNKFIFICVFVLSLFLIFYLTFGAFGSAISNVLNMIFNLIAEKLRQIISRTNINILIIDFIFDGIISAVLSVISFVPQIIILMFFLNLLEDIGFMSRVAFMFDGALKKVGLSGKSLFSLMMGFGCTSGAILTTRNLENVTLRKRTIFLLPFMSCTAKLPVFLVVTSLFFEKYKFIFVFGLYLFSIFLSLIFSIFFKKIFPESNDFFILEMPKYRFPNFKKIVTDIWIVIYDFITKIGSVIILFSGVIWLLQNFNFNLEYLSGKNFENSILYFFASKISFVFKPIGLDNVGVVCALIFGFVAKEMVLVGLAMINGVAGESLAVLSASLISGSSVCSFSLVSSVIFLVFVLLYSPCISAITTIKNELGFKCAISVLILQFLTAYLVSFILFLLLQNFSFLISVLLFLLLAVFIIFVLRLGRKKKCIRGCNACRKVCS